MGLSLWKLFKVGLLLLNSVMILHRQRFLAKYGLADFSTTATAAHDPNQNPIKSQLVGLLHAVSYLKFPVIIANTVTIVFEMLLGGT